jgi:hypothetical protein
MSCQLSTTALQITCLNNDGADLIESGNTAAAIQAFTQVVRVSKDLIRHYERDSTDMALNSTPVRYSMDQIIEFSTTPAEDREGDEHFVFRRAVRIQNPRSSPTARRILSEDGLEMMAAVAIFNLALSFHLSTVKDDETLALRKNEGLQKAVQLYECAFELLYSEDWASSSFVTMAILMNLAHAHALLGNTQVSEDCSQQLMSALMFLVVETQDAHISVDGVKFDYFFRSLLHLVFGTRERSTAPAA